jgi:macrolide transport system ATP-binding/permease protein
MYAGAARAMRHERARALLTRLKLEDRLAHKPTQLSGGQQQRVSIARALMNGGSLILADEPTGALDSHVGEEVLEILRRLNAEGHTLVLVTHDRKIAAHCDRVVTLSDGQIDSDRRTSPHPTTPPLEVLRSETPSHSSFHREEPVSGLLELSVADRLTDALHQAVLSMRARRLRTFLTMLGIIIGIASVSCVVAVGVGGRERVLASIKAIGTNTLDVYPGRNFGDERAGTVRTLIPDDATALSALPGIDSVTPSVSTQATLRVGDLSVTGMVNGVGEDYFRVHDIEFSVGNPFTHQHTERLAQVLVIDDPSRVKLFPNVSDPVGRVVFVSRTPFEVVGVTNPGSDAFRMAQNLTAWAPYTSVLGRLTGPRSLTSITARVSDAAPIDLMANSVIRLLTARHGRKDFMIRNTDTIRKAIEQSTATLTLVIASIALISLVVGGIGVMNIMLVSVSERTREIGVRTAVGARRRDILLQFLIEAVLICLIGGALGVALALAIGLGLRFFAHFPMIFSTAAIVAAVAVSTLTGLAFGFFPARHAAQLSPVDALARE